MKPTTVDDYIESFPEAQRAKLTELRTTLLAALPGTSEALKWGSPAILDADGMILLIFAGYKHHINLVATPSTKEALADALTEFKTGKGSIQLAYDEPLPVELVRTVALHRAEEYRERGVKWM